MGGGERRLRREIGEERDKELNEHITHLQLKLLCRSQPWGTLLTCTDFRRNSVGVISMVVEHYFYPNHTGVCRLVH